MLIRLIKWLRVQFFGPPRSKRRQEQSVLAWRFRGTPVQKNKKL